MKTSADAATAFAAREKVNKLLTAAREGDISSLKDALQSFNEGQDLVKAIVDVKDANGRGALHFAAQNNKDAMCRYLLEELNVPVDLKDDDGETALIHAARYGHFQTVKCLLDHGADPTIKGNKMDATALHHAASSGSTDVVKLLLEKGVNVDVSSDAGPPLIWAAGDARLDVVKVLVDHGADVNAVTDDDVTPLVAATAAGACNVVDLLLEKGANVNITVGGVTPLHIAADTGNERLVMSLLKAGADANAKDEDGEKPLMVAAMKGSQEVVKALLPATTPDPRITDWSCEGVLSFGQELTKEEHKSLDGGEEGLKEKASENGKPFTPVELSQERKEKSLEAKARGDEAFKIKNYMSALDAYTQALEFDPNNATILSNRSLCWMRTGQPEHALADAKLVRQIRPDWAKGCYREGSALRLLERYEDAANAFYEGVQLDPNNKELIDAFREAVKAGKNFYSKNCKKT